MRQLLSKSHGPLIAVNTLKKASQLLRIQLYILGANLEGSSWGACSIQNLFAAIAETDGEDDDEQCVRQYQVACTQHDSHMKTRDREILSVDRVKHLDLTIDSGAGEDVIGPKIVPQVPVQTSVGSKKGVHDVAANGTKMVNQGEQVVSATTGSGQRCRFKLQVTDVHRPLMSVSRLCDAGHRVVFEANSGYIQSVATGEKVQFRRDNNVYRLGVSLFRQEIFPGRVSNTCKSFT